MTVISHKGSFVRQLTASDIREIYEIRRIVETGCCIRVETGRWTQLAPVFTAAFTQARSAMRDGEWRMAGTASLLFHRLLVGACGSDQLTAFFDNICAQMRLAFQMVQPQDAIQRPWLEKDVAIFETLREGKTGQAITLIEDYLKYSEDLLFTLIPGIDE
ncbi:FCD domain-containing protein [Komagataeibacter saccharivorans]|uniref:FCD domain-containing protein n=1 Tax=Komagataeibacter saccharivorans TaxID=265959 RepID=UPI0039EB7F4D